MASAEAKPSACFHRLIIGRPSGLPHGVEAQGERRQHHGVRGRARGQGLPRSAESSTAGLQCAATATISGARNALSRSALQSLCAKLRLGALRVSANSSPRRSRAPPRTTTKRQDAAAVVGGAHRTGKNELERALRPAPLGQLPAERRCRSASMACIAYCRRLASC